MMGIVGLLGVGEREVLLILFDNLVHQLEGGIFILLFWAEVDALTATACWVFGYPFAIVVAIENTSGLRIELCIVEADADVVAPMVCNFDLVARFASRQLFSHYYTELFTVQRNAVAVDEFFFQIMGFF